MAINNLQEYSLKILHKIAMIYYEPSSKKISASLNNIKHIPNQKKIISFQELSSIFFHFFN